VSARRCVQLAKYFERVSYKGGVALGVIGLILLPTGSAGAVFVGLLIAGLGAFLIYRQVAGRPTDADIERQLHAVVAGLRERALEKLGLDADEVKLIDPIIVGGHSAVGRDIQGARQLVRNKKMHMPS
jgi:hypothetical protein